MNIIDKINQKLKHSINYNKRDVIVAICINSLNQLLSATQDEKEIFIIKHMLCELSKQLNTNVPFKLKNKCIDCYTCDILKYVYKNKLIPKLPQLRMLLENSDDLLWEDETLILLEK